MEKIIFLLDDDLDNLDGLAIILSKLFSENKIQVSILKFSNADSFLDAFDDYTPDGIVVDGKLPKGWTGPKVIETLRSWKFKPVAVLYHGGSVTLPPNFSCTEIIKNPGQIMEDCRKIFEVLKAN